jgi:uncharacterized integral membrane protein
VTMNPTPRHHVDQTEAIEELVRANSESNTTMQRLVDHVRKETEARDRKIDALDRTQRTMRWLLAVCTVSTIVLLIIAVINTTNIAAQRRSAARQAAIGMQVQQTNKTLLDCLNSTGACGQINQQQQNLLLDKVKQYELTGFYCIRTNPALKDPNGELFLKCMERLYPGGPTLNGR